MGRLGHLESKIMNSLWASGGPLAPREVLGILRADREIADTSVMTVLDNLFGKDLLVRQLDGRAYRYAAVRARDQYTALLMEEALATSSNAAATLLHFVDNISPADAMQLRQALEELVQQSEQS